MISMIETVLAMVTATLALILWYMQSTAKKRAMLVKIPGPPPLPLIGNTHEFKTDGADFYGQIMEFCKDFNEAPIFKVMLGTKALILCHHPDAVEFLLSSNKHITKSTDYDFVMPWLGTGLLTSTGEKWHSRRKLLTPTFHFRILVDFLRVFNEQADIMVARLKEKCGKGTFDIFPFITYCALDIILETAMGKKINAQTGGALTDYVDAISKISELIQARQKQPWLWPDFIYNKLESGKRFNKYLQILQGFTKKVIMERIEEEKDDPEQMDAEDEHLLGKRRRLAFLDLLLKMATEAGFTQEDIREEVDTFMFEGHDTTAAAMNWAVHLIGANPHVQKRLHEEMDSIFGDSDRPATMDDMRDMKYLECIIKESLRLFPSVPLFGRHLLEDIDICGYMVPKGSSLVVFTPALHRNGNFFPNPELFDPDRFTMDNATGRHPYAYVPFSAGPRNCIGQRFAMNEEKVLLASIARNFNIESMQRREDLNPVGEIILRPENGIHIKLTKRHK